MDWAALITAAFAFWVVAASPGPANIANATVAMRFGRGPSLLFGLGLSVALVFWGLLAATGMGAVLQTSALLLGALKVLGGLYLLWLAWQSVQAARHVGPLPQTHVTAGRWFWRGLLLNLSNPKSVVAWMAALSLGLDAQATVSAVVVGTTLCCVAAFLNNLSYSLLFSLPGIMAGYTRARRWIDAAAAGLFALGGFGLLRSAFAR